MKRTGRENRERGDSYEWSAKGETTGRRETGETQGKKIGRGRGEWGV